MGSMSFCSADDLATNIQVASRFNSAGPANVYDMHRFGVTQAMANFCRRNWDYNNSIVEYFDSPHRKPREELIYYPEKINVDTGVPMILQFSYDRCWDGSATLSNGTDFWWDSEKRRLVVYNRYEIHQCPRAYRLTYAGGFKPLLDIHGDPTDVYDTSGGFEALRENCMHEACDRIEQYLNRTEGEQQHGALRNRTIEKKRIGGFLPEVARAIESYRKIYVAKA